MTGKLVPWVIDMGASNHMTGMIENFCDLTKIAHCPMACQIGAAELPLKRGPLFLIKIFVWKMSFTCQD